MFGVLKFKTRRSLRTGGKEVEITVFTRIEQVELRMENASRVE
jgi:hypothetical protein